MSVIITLCGARPNDCDCGYCLKMRDCREAREAICRGCVREGKCLPRYVQKCIERGECRGRELRG